MLMPRRTKYRKQFRGKMRGAAQTGNAVSFGEYGLQAKTTAWIDARQIEAARRAITGELRRGGKVWIRIFPDKPVSKKPVEVRMGKGKGAPEYLVSVVKPGRILFEIDGMDFEEAKETFRACSHKLPIKTKLVSRREF